MGKALHRNQLNIKDPLGFSSKTFLIQTTYFEDELLNYVFENQGEQTYQMINFFNWEDPAKIFASNKTTFISEKILHKIKYKDFALEFLEEKQLNCVNSS